jgi:hypothetical protein
MAHKESLDKIKVSFLRYMGNILPLDPCGCCSQGAIIGYYG